MEPQKMTSNQTRILLIEDHAGYRETIELALDQEADMTSIGSFGSAEVALRDLQDEATPVPDVILLDLHLPGMPGLEALRWIRTYAPQAETLVLTQSDNTTEIHKALEGGASGYLLKSATLNQILDGIRTVASGGASLDPEIARYVLNQLRRPPPEEAPEKSLSGREREVLQLLGDGLVKKEVADKLGISVTTVAYHVKHIYEKLDVANAPAAISKAFRTGILPGDAQDS